MGKIDKLLLALGPIGMFIYLTRHSFRGLSLDEPTIDINVDKMGGRDFEVFIVKLLRSRGFSAEATSYTGDFGADVIASKAGAKYAIQCKRNAIQTKVSVRAVQEAVAAIKYYDCDRAMVITPSRFTGQAIRYAEKVDCDLVDRDILMTWVKKYDDAFRRIVDNKNRANSRKRAKTKAQARSLKERLIKSDLDIVLALNQNRVEVLRELAVFLSMSRGKDRKSDLINRIAPHIEIQRAGRKHFPQAKSLKERLTKSDVDIVHTLSQDTVPVLRELATLLGMTRGTDRKSDLIKRIAAHIESRRAGRRPPA